MPDHQLSKTQENARRKSLELFKLETDDEPVKFMNTAAVERIRQGRRSVSGYFTLAKWFYGATPIDIEERLGLRRGEFGSVAFAVVFCRLPRFDEFEYCLTAAYPGGKHRTRDEDFASLASDTNAPPSVGAVSDRALTPVGRHYPRGDGVVHQWRLLNEIEISPLIRTITSSLPFARRDGSTNSHEPKLGKLRGVDWT